MIRWTKQELPGRLLIDKVAPPDLPRKLRQAEIDVGFCVILGDGYGPDTNTEVLLNDNMYVWARKGHPLTLKNRITIEDLSRMGWAFFGLGKNPTEYIQAHFGAKGYQSPQIALQSSSIGIARDAILNTDLIGILPEHFVREFVAKGALVKIPFQGLEVKERIGLVLSKSRPLTNAQEKLCQLVRDICTEDFMIN